MNSTPNLDGPIPENTGLMLVGHGTRDQRGTDEFFALADQLGRIVNPLPLAPCLLEFQPPSISQAWQTLVDRGVKHIRVCPLLLFAAGHAKQDIPDEVAAAAKATPGATFDQCRPISRQAAMVDLVDLRLRESIARIDGSQQTAVIMVGRGSYDPCAQADMKVLTQVVAGKHGGLEFETAFYAMADPRLPTVIDQIASSGRFTNIIVQPHLLFAGRLYEAIEKQVNQAEQRHPAIRFVLGDYLGPVEAVGEAIAARAGLGQARVGWALPTK